MRGKWIYLAQRNPRLSHAEFRERWFNHRRIGVMPQMVAEFVGPNYCAVRSDGLGLDSVSQEYDGVGLFALNGLYSIPTIASIIRSDYIQADEKRFFTTTCDQFSMFLAEDVVIEGPETGFLVVQFLRRHGEVPPTDFLDRWQREHVAAIESGAALKAGVKRYVRNMMVAPPPPGHGYAGIAELWFESAEAMLVAAPEIDAMLAGSGFIDPANSFCVLGDIIMSRPRKDQAEAADGSAHS